MSEATETYCCIDALEYDIMQRDYEKRLMREGPQQYGRYVAHKALNNFREGLGQEREPWDPCDCDPDTPDQEGDGE